MSRYSAFVPGSEQEWLQWRAQGIGASDIAALFDMHPFMNKAKLWQRLALGQLDNKFYSAAMHRGKELEPTIAAYIAETFNLGDDYVEQLCVEYVDNPVIRATLDVYSKTKNALWEMKYVSDMNRYIQMQQPPVYHMMQVQQQLLITGAAIGYYVFTHDGYNFRFFEVLPDREVFESIIREVDRFMTNHVLPKQPPDSVIRYRDVSKSEEITSRCLRLSKIQHLVEEANEIKKELRDLTEEPFEYAGIRCGITPRKGSVNYERLLSHPAIKNAMEANNISAEDCREPGEIFKRIYTV